MQLMLDPKRAGRPIVVGVDDTPRADDALALGARFAALIHAPLLLVCAYPCSPADIRSSDATQRAARRRARLTAERAAQRADLECRVLIAHGSPADVLRRVAREADARLVVVGAARGGRLRALLPGTTGERLLRGARAPLAIAPDGYRDLPPRGFERVTCAFDGSRHALAALRVARDVAGASRASLRVVCVAGPRARSEWDGADAASRHAAAERTLADAVDIGEEAVVLHGRTVQVLTTESARADLLVLGSRGYGPQESVSVGAVSGRVVHAASCPVLLTPRGAVARLRDPSAAAAAAARPGPHRGQGAHLPA